MCLICLKSPRAHSWPAGPSFEIFILSMYLPTSLTVETLGGEGRDDQAGANRSVSLWRNDATAAPADPLG